MADSMASREAKLEGAASEAERQLTYLLVIELLAYQFASPVKWIETQDVLLREMRRQNFIEIGPSDVLTGMLKKTVQRQAQQEAILGLNRKFLSYANDTKDLYRGLTTDDDLVDEREASPDLAETVEVSTISSTSLPVGANSLESTVAATANAITDVVLNTAFADVPITAKEVVAGLMAQKLGKRVTEISMEKSIKQLAGGRSILENEAVGELEAEFGSTPEQAESTALHVLCEQLQRSGFSGQLGKVSNGAIVKFVSSKMPGGFGVPQIRRYALDRWNLGPGRQDAVLVQACADQPRARFQSQAEAEAFWDSNVEAYLRAQGLPTSAVSHVAVKASLGAATATASVDMINPAEHQAHVKVQNASRLRELEFQARLLGVDIHAAAKADSKAQHNNMSLQTSLDSLTAELGETFISGIRPKWSASMARTFDSYWNWALQDLITDFYGILRCEISPAERSVALRLDTVKSRASPRLTRVAKYLKRKVQKNQGDKPTQSSRYLDQVISAGEASLKHPTVNNFARATIQRAFAPRTEVDEDGKTEYTETPRDDSQPFAGIVVKAQQNGDWKTDPELTAAYYDLLNSACATSSEDTESLSFAGKAVLLTGAGQGSIAAELLPGLLSGGATVILTTSSFSSGNLRFYQEIYQSHGSKGSSLIVVPFNQASHQDVDSLIDWIYDPTKGLGLHLDHIFPFAAISESGREIDGIDSKSELAHRLMLTNVYRLLGHVIRRKVAHDHRGRITQIILPLSPNHGIFGGDGLYAESKLGLETLFAKWHSESWSDHISLCGASIGWTRGTGLMKSNDIVAEGIESSLGVRTFSTSEMALYLLILTGQSFSERNETAPLLVDLTGGLDQCHDLKAAVGKIRSDINDRVEIRKAVALDHSYDFCEDDDTAEPAFKPLPQQANLKLNFPKLPDFKEDLLPLVKNLPGSLDLDRIVVVTGFGEVGPYGSARTRWEMEAVGKLSLEGCIELAWVMGLVKFHDGDLSGERYIGWVDAKTSSPIADLEIKNRYESDILAHTGIRLVEPELDIGYGPDPTKRHMLQEIVLTEDMPMITASRETAASLKLEHGEMVDVYENGADGDVHIRIKQGATIMVPKALQVNHAIAGQIPSGWNPEVYGIPSEIVQQVDRITLFTLVCVAEALLSSGMTDAYEWYQYIHVSEVGNCIGSGLGGVHALKGIFRSRYHDVPVQTDVLQETFINTTAAWVNMLLISGAGAIRTPVGACATALESLESGYELITHGNAKVCLVGGVDDLDQDISVEFANMGATVDPGEELKKGRAPGEASRPATSSRKGFVEAHGSGVQVLTSARLAIDMGLPIHAIIALASTASDKAGRSIPAPGQGILTNAREAPGKFHSPLLDISYRRRRLEARQKQIDESRDMELELLAAEEKGNCANEEDGESQHNQTPFEERRHWIMLEAARQHKAALGTFGHLFWKDDPQIAPLRGALSVWGLTVDDLDFASFHGTSTVKNDVNETGVIQRQLEHLGRSEGNALFGIFQKYLSGHSKGAAAAWMLNGCLQVLDSGLIPGQRNADNIDSKLEERDFVLYPNRSIQTSGLNAFSVTSFGFGQKGAQAIGIHPKFLFALLGESEYATYCSKARERARKASQSFTCALATNSMCVLKTEPPWPAGQEEATLLNPRARLT